MEKIELEFLDKIDIEITNYVADTSGGAKRDIENIAGIAKLIFIKTADYIIGDAEVMEE